MSAGGLTGAGGGSLTGTVVQPGSVKPDASAIIKYNNAGQQRSASNAKQTGDSNKRGDDAKSAGDGDAKTLGEQQSRKAQDFDAVYGRPPLREQSSGKQKDRGNDESAFDVVRRADKGAAEVVYGAAGEVVGTVNDAAGAVLHGAFGWTGVDTFKGHAERNQARGEGMWNAGKATVEAAKSPVETVEKGIETVKAEGAEIAGEWEAGRYGDLAERGGQVAGAVTVGVFGGAATKVLRRSDGPDGVKGSDDTGSAAKGPDAPGGKAEGQDTGKVDEAASAPQWDVTVSEKQAQKKFKHAGGLGVEGPYNSIKGREFSEKIKEFVKDDSHRRIDGHYQGKPATIYVDEGSRQAVVVKPNGDYWTNWTMSERQFEHVIKDGKLGGN